MYLAASHLANRKELHHPEEKKGFLKTEKRRNRRKEKEKRGNRKEEIISNECIVLGKVAFLSDLEGVYQ